jgi:succinoglycan biosynthesis protein ExoW
VRKRRLPDFQLLARWAWRDPALFASVFQLAGGKLSK